MKIQRILAPLSLASRWLTPEECRCLGAQLALWEIVLLILSLLL